VGEFIKAFGVQRLALLAASVFGLGLFFLYVVTVVQTQPMDLLFSQLDPKMAGEIVQRLQTQNVPYELRGDGTQIMVPSDQVLKLRMQMAAEGLPSGGNVGYEIFDKGEAFGVTSFQQNINRLRALEGELARTIGSLEPVGNARVHLVIPERSPLQTRSGEPSASVVVRTRGRLDRGNVAAIQHLVSAAVPGLMPESVTVIDERGQLLGGGRQSSEPGALGSAADERRAAFEERLRQQVETIVSSVVGPGNAQVQVSAEMDFSRVTRAQETFDPEGQVVRSTDTIASTAAQTEGAESDTVSVVNGLPGQEQEGGQGTGPSSNEQRTQERVNYEISKTTETAVKEGGRLTRLSVAVVVDHAMQQAEDGTVSWAPRDAAETQQIEALVRSAVGFDEKRGDQLQVQNLRFTRPVLDGGEAVEDGILGVPMAELFRMGQTVLIVLIGALVALFVVRPMIDRLLGPVLQGTGVPALAGAGAGAGGAGLPVPASGPSPEMTAALQAHLGEGGAMQALPAPRSEAEQMIDIGRVQGQVKESSIRKVGEVVQNHPEESVAILRTWLHSSS